MYRQLQPSAPPLVTLVKTEPPTVIKNEPPEEASQKEISPDIKNIDIVDHSLAEDVIKREIVPENILETKYLESVQTQVVWIKTEATSDEHVTGDIKQEVIEVQGSHEHSNTSNLETHEQLVLNSSNGTTSWEEEKEKIKITPLAKDEHVCKHCQHAYNSLRSLKCHIRQIHGEVTAMYQCPYCPYKSKWNVQRHIIQIHKRTKDIQWFPCNLCEGKFKLKAHLTQHMEVHLRHKQMKDRLDLRKMRHQCNKCNYKTYKSTNLKSHKLTHLKPEEIEYFYCYHCAYKCKRKHYIKSHIFRHHFKNGKQAKRYSCNTCDYETYTNTQLQRHKLTHLKPEEIEYFYCYHCSHKNKNKQQLKKHIFRQHFKNVKQGKRTTN